MENPRGFFHVLRTGQRALSFHRCPFLLRKGWKGGCYGLFRYEGWKVQRDEMWEVWRRSLPFP